MRQLITTWSVNTAGQCRVQDVEDGRIHTNMETYGLLIYGRPLTPVRSLSEALMVL